MSSPYNKTNSLQPLEENASSREIPSLKLGDIGAFLYGNRLISYYYKANFHIGYYPPNSYREKWTVNQLHNSDYHADFYTDFFQEDDE